MSEPAIRLRGVRRHYDDGRVEALRGIDLEVARGEFVALMGPSGSGKSTLLNLIGAMDLPSEGEVWLDGVLLRAARDLDDVRARKVGFVFQMHNLIPVLTAEQNVEIPMVPRPIPRAARRERARALLGQVGLGHRVATNVKKLSGGERQRVAIARAIANEPPILLADEPTGNLDSATGREVMSVLHEVRKRTGMTLVLVTHNEEICEGADRLLRMHDGMLLAEPTDRRP
jgi:putative ABC transport system ATP-binding protein